MKKNFYRNLACMLILTGGLCIATSTKAQVTVGSKGVPNTGALLDMKQKEKTDGSANSDKGLGLPRVALTAVDKLDPCVVTTGVATTDDAAKKSHIGLTVYNTTNNTSTAATLSEGVYAWDGAMWTQYSGTTAGGAENGLSMSGRKVILGGPLNQPTTITGTAANNLTLNTPTKVGSTLRVTGATTLGSTLGVTGATTLNDVTVGTTTAKKTATVNGTLTVIGNESVGGSSTIGMNTATHTVGALLEIRNKQQDLTGVTDVRDPKMVSSDKGGLLLPRVELVSLASLEPFIATTDPSWMNATKKQELSLSLAGLMVYNIAVSGNKIYPAIYVWSGTSWITSQQSASQLVVDNSLATKTKSFTFYELGTETTTSTPVKFEPLKVTVTGALGTPTYQWYQMTGSNVHVRAGAKIIGATSDTFYPVNGLTFDSNGDILTSESVLKGPTRNAKNTGFYRYYCVITDGYREVQTEIVEVAVGCGAKNNNGDWISFMCFNLGAGEYLGNVGGSYNGISIENQKTRPLIHTILDKGGHKGYVPGEEVVWGDLYQWGRIADGHEKRNSTISNAYPPITDIGNGFLCGLATDDATSPQNQIKPTSPGYGKFIANGYVSWTSGNKSLLWGNGNLIHLNDPCTHFKLDGTISPFWNTTGNGSTTSPACQNENLGWRIPTSEDFYTIISGTANSTPLNMTTANSLKWYQPESIVGNLTKTKGIEFQPDNATTTLFIPAAGNRNAGNGQQEYVSMVVYAWTSSSSYNSLVINSDAAAVSPYFIGSGRSLRCIKK